MQRPERSRKQVAAQAIERLNGRCLDFESRRSLRLWFRRVATEEQNVAAERDGFSVGGAEVLVGIPGLVRRQGVGAERYPSLTWSGAALELGATNNVSYL